MDKLKDCLKRLNIGSDQHNKSREKSASELGEWSGDLKDARKTVTDSFKKTYDSLRSIPGLEKPYDPSLVETFMKRAASYAAYLNTYLEKIKEEQEAPMNQPKRMILALERSTCKHNMKEIEKIRDQINKDNTESNWRNKRYSIDCDFERQDLRMILSREHMEIPLSKYADHWEGDDWRYCLLPTGDSPSMLKNLTQDDYDSATHLLFIGEREATKRTLGKNDILFACHMEFEHILRILRIQEGKLQENPSQLRSLRNSSNIWRSLYIQAYKEWYAEKNQTQLPVFNIKKKEYDKEAQKSAKDIESVASSSDSISVQRHNTYWFARFLPLCYNEENHPAHEACGEFKKVYTPVREKYKQLKEQEKSTPNEAITAEKEERQKLLIEQILQKDEPPDPFEDEFNILGGDEIL